MKKTILERIENLKGMMNRMEHPDLVVAEVTEIFDTIHKTQDEEIKEVAMLAMAELAVDLMTESPLSSLLNKLGKKERKVIPVNIKVSDYLDATVIKIDKKIPYKNLLSILNKARKNFDETTDSLFSASYCKTDKRLHMEYIKDIHKEIIIDMSAWNMSDELAEVYVSGLVEYISK